MNFTLQTSEQRSAYESLTPEQQVDVTRMMADGYHLMLPFAELYETHGLPVDIIGLELEQAGIITDYSSLGEEGLRSLFKQIIKERDLLAGLRSLEAEART